MKVSTEEHGSSQAGYSAESDHESSVLWKPLEHPEDLTLYTHEDGIDLPLSIYSVAMESYLGGKRDLFKPSSCLSCIFRRPRLPPEVQHQKSLFVDFASQHFDVSVFLHQSLLEGVLLELFNIQPEEIHFDKPVRVLTKCQHFCSTLRRSLEMPLIPVTLLFLLFLAKRTPTKLEKILQLANHDFYPFPLLPAAVEVCEQLLELFQQRNINIFSQDSPDPAEVFDYLASMLIIWGRLYVENRLTMLSATEATGHLVHFIETNSLSLESKMNQKQSLIN